MKLYKALKLKNKLATEISQLKTKILANNSRKETDVNYYDVKLLFEELSEKVDKLILLKKSINEKNVEIQHKLYEIAEYKGIISFLKHLETKEGIQRVNKFGETTEDKFVVTINEIGKEELILEFQKMVDDLQEEIDVFNYTADIEF